MAAAHRNKIVRVATQKPTLPDPMPYEKSAIFAHHDPLHYGPRRKVETIAMWTAIGMGITTTLAFYIGVTVIGL